MKTNIEAIMLDVGNTLRILVNDPEFQEQARLQLYALVEPNISLDEFFEELTERYKRYRKQAKSTLIEASEKDLWTKWMLSDFPEEKIAPLSGKLTRLWRDHDGKRIPREDVKDTIIELARRGYILGIIANTITETEIPDWMETDNVTEYFKTVVLSSKVGLRKPNPEIYWLAARNVGIDPAKCAYVGDNPVRDVEGTRKAGYGAMILIDEPATLAKEPPTGEYTPDFMIKNMSDLLDLFPPRE